MACPVKMYTDPYTYSAIKDFGLIEPTEGRLGSKTKNHGVLVGCSNGLKYFVCEVHGKNGSALLVIDEEFMESLTKKAISLHVTGYAYYGCVAVHRCILAVANTVDHSNRIKLDNRMENLREADMSEQNRNRSEPNNAIPADLLELVDMRVIPKDLYYDKIMERFEFHTSPYVLRLAENGIRVAMSGTRSAAFSMSEKLIDALDAYCVAGEKFAEVFPDLAALEEEECGKRSIQAQRYVNIVTAARTMRPSMPESGVDLSFDAYLPERFKAKKMRGLFMVATNMQPERVAKLGGSKNLAINEVAFPELNVMVRTKGNSYTISDFDFHEQMRHLNYESDDWRIFIHAAMAQHFPLLTQDSGRIQLGEFIWRFIAGRELPAGMTVAPINMIKHDVRLENLVLMPDNGRGGQKKPATTAFNKDTVGGVEFDFMPKGLTVSKDRGAHIFIVKYGEGAKSTKKFSFKDAVQGEKVFREQVLPFMRANFEDFDVRNALYQRLSKEAAQIAAAMEARN